MATYKKVTASNASPVDMALKGFSLIAAAGAAATLEVFDGTFGKIATIAVGAAGTGYSVDDVLTLAQANGGVQATVRVATIGGSGEVLTVALLTAGTGYAAATYATTGGTGDGNATITVSTLDTSTEKLLGVLKCPVSDIRKLVFPKSSINQNDGVSYRLTGASAQAYLYHN